MIDTFHKFAIRLNKVKWLLWLAFALSLGACAFVIFSKETSYRSETELAFFILPMWLLLLICMQLYFIRIEPIASKDDGFFKRMATSFKRFLMGLMAYVFILMSVLLFYLSYKAIMFSV